MSKLRAKATEAWRYLQTCKAKAAEMKRIAEEAEKAWRKAEEAACREEVQAMLNGAKP